MSKRLIERVTETLADHAIDRAGLAMDVVTQFNERMTGFDFIHLERDYHGYFPDHCFGKKVRCVCQFRPGDELTLGFSIRNPTDRWDDAVANATITERCDAIDKAYTFRIIERGEKCEKYIDKGKALIPHHAAPYLYLFLAQVRDVLGPYVRFPRWAHEFQKEMRKREKADAIAKDKRREEVAERRREEKNARRIAKTNSEALNAVAITRVQIAEKENVA